MEQKNVMMFILAAGVFGILNTEMGFIGILPYIAERYDVTIVQAGWLISLFALAVAVAGPTMPLIMSHFDRKTVMVFILGLFTLCNVVAVFADDFYVLLAVRVLPAFFHPVYCAMAFSVAAALARPGEVPKAVAKINVGVSAGMVAGVPISNFLAEQISLSASMTFFAVATFLVLLATLWLVPSMPAANLGCVIGTTISGWFIEAWGMQFVVLGGLSFCGIAALLILGQCGQRESGAGVEVKLDRA